MIVGMMRFNFTVTTGISADQLREAVLAQLAHIPGLDVARNTVSLQLDYQARLENPPMPEFHKVKGIVRER